MKVYNFLKTIKKKCTSCRSKPKVNNNNINNNLNVLGRKMYRNYNVKNFESIDEKIFYYQKRLEHLKKKIQSHKTRT